MYMTSVWLRTAVWSQFSPSICTWVLEIKLWSPGFCEKCLYSPHHLKDPENTDLRTFPIP